MILRCACCAGYAPAKKQWWNQDKGYGICARCFEWIAEREGLEQAQFSYGKAGLHHSLEHNENSAADGHS